jgi:hypothetical protein
MTPDDLGLGLRVCQVRPDPRFGGSRFAFDGERAIDVACSFGVLGRDARLPRVRLHQIASGERPDREGRAFLVSNTRGARSSRFAFGFRPLALLLGRLSAR